VEHTNVLFVLVLHERNKLDKHISILFAVDIIIM